MTQINQQGTNPLQALFHNLASTGAISPQGLLMVLQFMQQASAARQGQQGGYPQAGGHQCGGGAPQFGGGAGGGSPLGRPRMNPQQRQAIQQLRGLMGQNFNPFVRDLMNGGPQNIQNMMNQLPGCAGHGANGMQVVGPGQTANVNALGGAQVNILNNGGTVNVNAHGANGGPNAVQQGNTDKIKKKWLGVHGKGAKTICGKNEHGNIIKLNKGPYKGHTLVPTGNKGYNVFKGDPNSPANQVGTWDAPKGAKEDKTESPLTFDTNGDGKVSTVGKENGKKIDIDGDGKVDQSGWAGKGDGVLKFGKGDSGKELLGNNTDVRAAGKRAADSFRKAGNEQQAQAIEQRLASGKFDGKPANGFEALKQISALINPESVADGKLDKAELGVLEKTIGLRMEVDGQDRRLMDANVAGINLGYQQAGKNADENGNQHRQVGAGFIRNDGSNGKVNDVWFQYS